ncbi:MAG TPA: DUF503 domain-containing protein [Candidatus Hydrogenedentes bacterium]|nr:DUF503 domain-containing protein [Candidatus Hydrogenedentota bacterium]HQE83060.1 DUF503 domain-containing protein [Candidatus Hydrogenedentota bacterium]HQH53338.1 DUF503 domain-containing protein [Candidatus Hydrogenedentota bacterium]HQM49132.1 DUF503 domain-containing protein [Candidatus Hydrogenedentota bacterium]
MTIGVLKLDLLIFGARSLKDKRRVVKSLKDRIRQKFNGSVAEIDFLDEWQRARLAVCVVSRESRFANAQLNEIARFAISNCAAEVANIEIEML